MQEGYDVYVYEPEPLEAGESKHILSVFVADESGMINRICGVFARRGKAFSSILQHAQTLDIETVVIVLELSPPLSKATHPVLCPVAALICLS